MIKPSCRLSRTVVLSGLFAAQVFALVLGFAGPLFAGAVHRDVFAGDPKRYAPRCGGFCTGGMAIGFVLRMDPQAWVIIDDWLYLNYGERCTEEFMEAAPREIARADANWKVIGKLEV